MVDHHSPVGSADSSGGHCKSTPPTFTDVVREGRAASIGSPTAPSSSTQPRLTADPSTGKSKSLISAILCDNSDSNVSFPVSRSGDSVSITIDESYYAGRVKACAPLLTVRFLTNQGQSPLTQSDFTAALKALWNVHDLSLISLGKGFFNLFIPDAEQRRSILKHRHFDLEAGKLRVQRWTPAFNPYKSRSSTVAVWIRIFELPFELWTKRILLSIASAVGSPIRIDDRALNGSLGRFARVLVDINMLDCTFSSSISLVAAGITFDVSIGYENIPPFCSYCHFLGHLENACKKLKRKPKATHDFQKQKPQWKAKPSVRSDAAGGSQSDPIQQPGKADSQHTASHSGPIQQLGAALPAAKPSDAGVSHPDWELVKGSSPSLSVGSDSGALKRQQQVPIALQLSNRFAMIDDDEDNMELAMTDHEQDVGDESPKARHTVVQPSPLADLTASPDFLQAAINAIARVAHEMDMEQEAETSKIQEAALFNPSTDEMEDKRLEKALMEVIPQGLIVNQPSDVQANYEFVEPTTDYNNLVTSEEFPTLESSKVKQKRGRNIQSFQQTMKPNTRLQERLTSGIKPIDQMQLIAAMELKRRQNEIG